MSALAELIDVLRSKGVEQYSGPGPDGEHVAIRLGPIPLLPGSIKEAVHREVGMAEGQPTEDELLFASSPYPITKDELEARKP